MSKTIYKGKNAYFPFVKGHGKKETFLVEIGHDGIMTVMLSRHTYEGNTWIDLDSPTKDEISETFREFGLPEAIERALTLPTRHAEVELYDEAIFLVLHFPICHEGHEDERKEVDFVIGKNFLITAHYDSLDPIHKFANLFEDRNGIDKSNFGEHAGYIFYYMIRTLYRSLFEDLEGIEDQLDSAERKVFNGGERTMVRVLSEINKELLDFKQATRSHERVLESLQIVGRKFFGEEFSYHLRSIKSEFHKVWGALETHKETLEELRQTNDALLSAGTTRVMKTLTVITFATSPSIIIAGIFGMNTAHDPIIGNANDFWIVVVLILFFTATILLFFAYKKWL